MAGTPSVLVRVHPRPGVVSWTSECGGLRPVDEPVCHGGMGQTEGPVRPLLHN